MQNTFSKNTLFCSADLTGYLCIFYVDEYLSHLPRYFSGLPSPDLKNSSEVCTVKQSSSFLKQITWKHGQQQ
jgi:hypothetical protein